MSDIVLSFLVSFVGLNGHKNAIHVSEKVEHTATTTLDMLYLISSDTRVVRIPKHRMPPNA
jgi:hypothetical protein